ncbi:outer membrane beta-barrel protein [Fluviicola sp.]|uniref:outer membrane beta-barrel protein n=1 Tax=Fluviicola sp. TaxID=1917219 RepID=UPI003D27E173
MMKNNEHKQLNQVLKDQLAEGTAHVPNFVWDRIEEELFPEKKRRGFFWWLFGGICMLLIAILLGLAFSGEKAHSQNSSFSQHAAISASRKEVTTKVENDGVVALKFFKTKKDSQYNVPITNGIGAERIENSRFVISNQPFNPNNTYRKNRKYNHTIHPNSNPLILLSAGNLPSEKAAIEHAITGENQPILPLTEDPIIQLTPEKQQQLANSEVETKMDPILKKDLSYEEILAIIQSDFPESSHELNESKRNSPFSLGIYGGPSLYKTAVLKDYFTSGQLSNRSFASSGFELGLQGRFKIGNRFQIYAGFAFNQKQTQFNYNLAITEMDYFIYVANGEKVPFEHIRDDGANSCFLAKDVHVHYQTRSILISLGTNFEFLKIGKFSAAVDLRLSCNVYSSLSLKEIRVLDIQQPKSENFSYFQPGAGLIFNYKLNDRISVGLSPFFSKQFYTKKSFLHRMDELVIPITCSFRL